MIAANISSAKFVPGRVSPIDAADLDALEVVIAPDGAPVTRGLGRESLDGQWGSLPRLVNLVIANGEIRPGQIVLRAGRTPTCIAIRPECTVGYA